MYQPKPMVSDPLDLVEIVPLISDPTITTKEIVDVFTMAIATTLENYRVLVLQLLVLQPLLSLRPHDGLELVPDQCQGHSTLRSHVLDGVLRLAIPNRDFPVGCS